jgi:hypothetical protein
VTPDEEEHIFLSSDYHGAHPDVMPELEPLLKREIGDFDLVIRDDPERPDVMNADKVAMVWVPLLETEEEAKKKKRDADAAKNAEDAKRISDRVEKIKGVREDYAKIRMEVPHMYVVAFHEKGKFVVYGEDAMNLMRTANCRFLPDKCGPRLVIREDRAVNAFRRILGIGRGLALSRLRADDDKWCKWEVYKLVDDEDDLDEIKEGGCP